LLQINIKILLIILFLFSLTFCSQKRESVIEKLTPPIVVVSRNGITEIEDSKGARAFLNTLDDVEYGTAFLKIGDTLKLKDD
tara:strand:- start:26876 stop:27121 length:246 start_codon:yes stop_codon:yes gene_type:complete